jgi:hypothetical protein
VRQAYTRNIPAIMIPRGLSITGRGYKRFKKYPAAMKQSNISGGGAMTPGLSFIDILFY